MSEELRLALIGSLRLALGGVAMNRLVSGKALALLSYLAMTGRAHSRQALAGLLWGELPEEDARRNLRVTLAELRKQLDPYLLISRQELAFNRESPYWLDVEVFRHTLKGRGLTPAEQPTEQLRETIELYRGDFLEDFYVRDAPMFDEWVLGQRERLRKLVLEALHTLSARMIELHEYTAGIDYTSRLLALDPWREEAHRQMMLLLALSGQRSMALAQYEVCRRVLADELGVEPAQETTALLQRIRSEQIGTFTAIEADRTAEDQPRAQRAAPMVRPKAPTHDVQVAELHSFIVGPPITQARQFFGRERELRRLFHLLQRPPLQNSAIIGPRRSGKTSLLHYLRSITVPQQLRPGQRSDWLPQPERYHWLFVDFQDARLGNRETLLRYLLAHMELPQPNPCDLDRFMEAVSDRLRSPTVILFDEIDVALQRYPELDDTFWESLRSLATNQVGGKLAFVLAASKDPTQLAQQSGLGSPFFNIFGYTAELGPIIEAAARELIAGSPIPFPDQDADWIVAQSGCWPILVQILGRERLIALEQGETDRLWQAEGLRQMLPFRHLLRQL
ncbi:MAG: AAA family ATPase [Chloroflexota bacterium]|nr:AAA family ATPase [Chloroflexota bacterium]